jgi:prepilin-type processing-associated H-X9-DG protein
LRCPLDTSDADRLALAASDGTGSGPYLFSYSFTGYGVGAADYQDLDPTGTANLGMSSVFDGIGAHIFKQSAVRNPGAKLMLVEEPGSMKDSPDGGSVINDGRWMPRVSPLTTIHGGKADTTFADGHVQPVTPEFGDDVTNSLPGL